MDIAAMLSPSLMRIPRNVSYFDNTPWSRYHDLFTLDDTFYPSRYPVIDLGYPRTRAVKGQVKVDKDKFQVSLNASQFRPEELTVKVVDKHLVIHGKHEEKIDEHGLVQREFTRRYPLPEGIDEDTVKSSFSRSGVLTVEALKKVTEPQSSNVRVVPISILQPKEESTQA